MITKNRLTNRLGLLRGQNEEGADIVQTILIIAMFVVVCIIVGTLVMNAITDQATDAADCIKNANQINNGACTNYSG